MDERSGRIARRFELPMLLAALLVIPVLIIEQSPHVSHTLRILGVALNWAIWLAFASELATMLAVVPRRRTWLREHPLEVVIVLLTPPFLPASLQAARLLRLARDAPRARSSGWDLQRPTSAKKLARMRAAVRGTSGCQKWPAKGRMTPVTRRSGGRLRVATPTTRAERRPRRPRSRAQVSSTPAVSARPPA